MHFVRPSPEFCTFFLLLFCWSWCFCLRLFFFFLLFCFLFVLFLLLTLFLTFRCLIYSCRRRTNMGCRTTYLLIIHSVWQLGRKHGNTVKVGPLGWSSPLLIFPFSGSSSELQKENRGSNYSKNKYNKQKQFLYSVGCLTCSHLTCNPPLDPRCLRHHCPPRPLCHCSSSSSSFLFLSLFLSSSLVCSLHLFNEKGRRKKRRKIT